MVATLVGQVAADTGGGLAVSTTPDFSALSWADDDVAVCFVNIWDDPGTITGPAGWTQVWQFADTAGTDGRAALFVETLVGGADTTPTFAFGGSFVGAAVLSIWRGVLEPGSWTVAANYNFDGFGGGAALAPKTVVMPSPGGVVVSAAGGRAAGGTVWTPPTGYTYGGAQITLETGASMAYKLRGPGSETAGVWTRSASGRIWATSVALAEAAAVPSQPTGATATAISPTEIDVDWVDVADETGYRVERSADGTTGWTNVSGTLAAGTITYTDTGLTPSTQYFYRVVAFNLVGDSTPSAVVDATTAAPPIPDPPDNPSATAQSATEILVEWDDVSDETGYRVERSLTGVGAWTDVSGALAVDSVSYLDSGLSSTTQYFYRVFAVNASGDSPASTVVSATTSVDAPTGVEAIAQSSTSINVEWDAVAEADGYRVERSVTGVGGWADVSGDLTSLSYLDSGLLIPETEYFYRVFAFNETGDSPASVVVSATTEATPPPGIPESVPWLEVWTRPGDPNYGKKIADLPFIDASVTVPYSGVGKGNMKVPIDYDRLDEILYINKFDDLPDSQWSTIKVMDDTGWLYEWLPIPRIPDGAKNATSVEFAGDGLEMMWGFARVEPWDWDGSASFVSTFPDWIWGGRNLLSNPDQESPDERPEVNEITHNASEGTFTLSDGVNTTPPIAFNQSDTSLENIIETYLTEIDDVLVTMTETEYTHMISVPEAPDVEGPTITTRVYSIEFVNPKIFPGGLIFDPGSLANPDLPIAIDEDHSAPGLEEGEDVVFIAELVRETYGALQPGGWTKSQTVSRGVPRDFGIYESFKVDTAHAHSAIYSLKIDPGEPINQNTRYAGAQQVVTVQPNGIYQASIWVYTTSATDTYRFVLRGIDEDFLTSSTGRLDSVTLTPNTWNQLVINDVNVGDNTQIIFRIANTNPPNTGDPVPFWVDDGEFNEGRMPTTIGCMLEEFYADATVDHAPARIVWQNETTGPSIDPCYLTLNFNCEVDSNGIAWDRDDVKQTFTPRMTYIQVLDQMVEEGGYNWRVVPNDVEAGTYFLQVYNPGTLGHVADAGIIGGTSDTTREARFFAPEATEMVAEGDESRFERAITPTLVAAFGRIEGSILDHNWVTPGAIWSGARMALDENFRGAESIIYTLASPAQRPLVAYRPGDRIRVHDPPIVHEYRRVQQIQLSMSKGQPDEFVVHISDAIPFRMVGGAGVKLARGLTGQAATDNAVAALLHAYKRRERHGGGGALNVGTGGMATVLVCNDSSSEMVRNKSDYIVPDFDDATPHLKTIIAQNPDLHTIWVHGSLTIRSRVVLPNGVQLVGLSINGSWLILEDTGQIVVGTEGQLRNFTLTGDVSDHAVVVGISASVDHMLCLGMNVTDGSTFVLDIGAHISDVWNHGSQTPVGTMTSPHAFIYLAGGSWQSVSRIMANGHEGVVVRGDNNHYSMISDVVTNGCTTDLILENCGYITVSGWLGSGGGDGVEPVVYLDACDLGITFSNCHWDAMTPGAQTLDFVTRRAAFYIYQCERVTIDISNQFTQFFADVNDTAEILLLGSHNNTISPTVVGQGFGGSHADVDFVRVIESHDNFISYGNYQPLGNETRHAINIDAFSERNIVAGNRFGDDTQYGGITLNDLGVGTVLYFPADAVIGDNFEDSTMGAGGLGGGVVLADLAYVHVQGVAAALWTIDHPLDFQPNVAVIDSAGEQVEGDVIYVDSDTITVEFSAAFSGTAYLS